MNALRNNDSREMHVQVAYYPESHTQELSCNTIFSVLRAQRDTPWDGKRLFLFLTSPVGQKLLAYTFPFFSPGEQMHLGLHTQQLNMLEIPQIDLSVASELDQRYSQLQDLLKQKEDIEKQIATITQQK